jgi:hypothetical protein
MTYGGEPGECQKRNRGKEAPFDAKKWTRSFVRPMECMEYLARFSEFIDGRTEAPVTQEMDLHRSRCEQCMKYSRTLEAGRELLRSLPDIEVPSDFNLRLENQIQSLSAGTGTPTSNGSLGSGAKGFAVLAVAGLMILAAWAPTLGPSGEGVDLPPVVVESPPPSFTQTERNPTFPKNLSIFTETEFQDGIWGDSHDLLREYSPIMDRRRHPAAIRVGIE